MGYQSSGTICNQDHSFRARFFFFVFNINFMFLIWLCRVTVAALEIFYLLCGMEDFSVATYEFLVAACGI